MLTAKDAASDVIQGLDCGADDYLTKPFSFEILLARLRAVSRRGAIARPVCLEVGDVKLDPASETKEQLMKDLETKAEMLLSAQGHYLRCIRVGHPEWATGERFATRQGWRDNLESVIRPAVEKWAARYA